MKRNQIQEGRISDHSHGLGSVTWAMVRHRARELAVINGRPPVEVMDSDFELARRELAGEGDVSPQEQLIDELPETERWDPVPGSIGRQVEKSPPDEEQTDFERLMQEGLDDAEHERMWLGSREEARQDQDIA